MPLALAFVQLKWHGRRRKSSEHSEQALSGEAALRGCKTWDVREALYFVVRGLPPIDLFYFCGMLRTSGVLIIDSSSFLVNRLRRTEAETKKQHYANY